VNNLDSFVVFQEAGSTDSSCWRGSAAVQFMIVAELPQKPMEVLRLEPCF
jgi:hypothetical protein